MTLDPTSAPAGRIGAIDALRGFVMLLMLVDHVRDVFYLHAHLRDPMDLGVTETGLAMTRLTSHLCAPVFILLTGLSASLYAGKHGTGAASRFLLTRGLFLIGLELTLVNLAWTGHILPPVLYLQVIWAIGLGMMALAGLLWLPRPALAAVAALVMLGHNLLDGIVLAPDQAGYTLWSILHQRGLLALPWGVARTSYPVLPWIGVAAAGYVLGPWFAIAPEARRRRLLALAAAALAGFTVLRGLNGYGDPVPWQAGSTLGTTILSFLNVTKYPPSADFLLLTLGLGLWLLALFEALPAARLAWLRVFGGAPLFFYLVHLWLLRGLYDLAFAAGLTGPSGKVELGSPAQLWLVALVLGPPLYLACRWMVGLKRRAKHPILSYL
ncbi:membrane protein [Methylobacterium tarhaniae]|uniref:Membrane protein n=1 Tax=Methylobacterium tarhaniae TaxID=1187852 RepID=A0A0J6TBX0_9HYPH|nr:heparan-alpha-glucosaminide N-acetyltransferase domain-containing protein [Methylobacterium tarhaniae]KMO44790.1 membrane protein [Methylobacterium tarhaniae]